MPRSTDALVLGRVVGDVLNPFTRSVSMRATYSKNREVINGCELKPSHVVNPPRVEIGDADFRTFYTLVLVDPDAPSPSDPCLREYLHWLVTDIPASLGPSYGHEVVSYESPRPSMGIHRYVLVLFRQSMRRQGVEAPGWRPFICLHCIFRYVAQEYANSGLLNEKSDVYSFGVLLLEAITGRDPVDYGRPADEVNLVDWLKMMVRNKRSEEVVDPKLETRPSTSALKRVILTSLRCVDPDAGKRPN